VASLISSATGYSLPSLQERKSKYAIGLLHLATSGTEGRSSSKYVPLDGTHSSVSHMLSVATDINHIVPEQRRQFEIQHDQNKAILLRIKSSMSYQVVQLKEVMAQLSGLYRKGTLRDPQTLYGTHPSHPLEPEKAASSLNDSR
jgi:hypothetical protein